MESDGGIGGGIGGVGGGEADAIAKGGAEAAPAKWRAVAPAGDSGLVPFAADDGRRMLCDVRGGISWPWPKRIGRRIAARGAVCAVGFEPMPRGGAVSGPVAHLLRWTLADTVDAGIGADGWPAEPGIAGEVRECALSLRCWRFTGWATDDRQWPVLRQMKGMLADMRPMPAVLDVPTPEPHEADAAVARWAGRIEIGRDALTQIGLEESEDVMGLRPLTEALAAAIMNWEQSPWRKPPEAGWRPVARSEVADIGYGRGWI